MEHLPLLGPSLALIFGRQSLGSSKVLYQFIYDPVTFLFLWFYHRIISDSFPAALAVLLYLGRSSPT
jgi:hypothetical protein